jgi:hypothetical protein
MQDEYQRLRELSRKYSHEIASLPQGTVSIKKRHNSDYLYLACRRDGKVKFDYIGLVGSDHACKVLEQVELRKDFEKKLRQVNSDLQDIEKVIHGRKI